MSDNWRIRTQFDNRSATAQPSASLGVGATVIPAPRGKDIPVTIQKGQTSRILELYGDNTPEVLEAIAYNTKYPLMLVAPHKDGLRGGVMVTASGLVPFTFVNDNINFNSVATREQLGIGDGTTTGFAKILSNYSRYVNQSLDIYVNGVLVDLDATNADTEVITAAAAAGTGSYIRATGAFEFSFAVAPAVGARVEVQYNTNWASVAYAAVGMAFPCVDFLAAGIYESDNEGTFLLDIQTKKNGAYLQKDGFPMEFSFVAGAVNGKKQRIFLEDLTKDHDLLFSKVNTALSVTTITESTTLTDFVGGHRGSAIEGADLASAWTKFNPRQYKADIYFDVTADPAVPAALVALREIKKRKRFLFPQPIQTAETQVTAGALSISNRGVSTFWGAGEIVNPYANTGNLISTLMGEVAAKFADALVFSFGGRAVAWADENNVGGQLGMGRIVKMVHDADETQLQAMDKLRINPIIAHETLGYTIVSRRTTDKSDSNYSYTDYSAVVDYIAERLENEVLPLQLAKFNDDVHRSIVKTKADSIISPLLVVPNNVIREFLTKCDSENNGDDVLDREEFILTVAIKVTPKSEFIVLNLINSPQGSRLEEVV